MSTSIAPPPVRVDAESYALACAACESAGWIGQAIPDAVGCMLNAGLTPHGIVLSFLDCKRRIQ